MSWTRITAVTFVAVVAACRGGDDAAPRPSATSADPAQATSLDTRQPHERPAGGWLRHTGVEQPLPVGTTATDSSPALDAHARRVADELPGDLETTETRELLLDGCVLRRNVVAGADWGVVFVAMEQLDDTRSLFSIPIGHDATFETYDDGSELVTDDFHADGARHTVLFVSPEGLFVEVIAIGENAPNLAGWPTTMPPSTGPQPEPGPAPLTFPELERLARALADAAT